MATAILSQAMLEQRHKMAVQEVEKEMSAEMQRQMDELQAELQQELQQELEVRLHRISSYKTRICE